MEFVPLGLSGVNSAVKAVTGKSILQHCGKSVNRLRANVLGIGAEYMGHALADKVADEAWKAAEAKLAGPDRDERLRFSHHLEALSNVLQSVASSRAVEDDSVKLALNDLCSSLERAFKVAGSDDGRRSSDADIDGYMQQLQLVFAAANAKRAEDSHDDIREIREMLATEDNLRGCQRSVANYRAEMSRMEKAPVQVVVVAQPNQVANPPGTPPGGAMIEVAYCGVTTWIIGLLLFPYVCCCPCDKMTVYRAPDGTLYNMKGEATNPPCMKM